MMAPSRAATAVAEGFHCAGNPVHPKPRNAELPNHRRKPIVGYMVSYISN